MLRYLYRIFFSFLIISILFFIYLSYVGLSTDKFNKVIKDKSNKFLKGSSLEFDLTKIYFDIKKISFIVDLKKPRILIGNKELLLEKVVATLPIKSITSNNNIIKNIEISTSRNNLRDISYLSSQYLSLPVSFIINKSIKEGFLKAKIQIPFTKDGEIDSNFKIFGTVSKARLKLVKDIQIKNLNFDFNYFKSKTDIKIKRGSISSLILDDSSIIISKTKKLLNQYKAEGVLVTQGDVNLKEVKILSKFLNYKIENINSIKSTINLKNKFDIELSRKYKISNFSLNSYGKISKMNIDGKIKKFKQFPDLKLPVNFESVDLDILVSKNKSKVKASGKYSFKDAFDKFEINYLVSKKNNEKNLSGKLELNNSKVNIKEINYTKKNNVSADLNFNVNFLDKRNTLIKNLKYSENKNMVYIKDLHIDEELKIKNIKNVELKTFLNNTIDNNFTILNKESLEITGDIFNASYLLDNLFKEKKEKLFSNKFKRKLTIKFSEVKTKLNGIIYDFILIGNINNGSINDLVAKGNFSDNEILELSIYKKNGEKTVQLFSDRAEPFLKGLTFTKGFQGGKLEYESITKNKISKTNLTILNFKVSKVPALAQLLSLASLQGIADTMSGEGISFNSLEMQLSESNNVISVEDAFASGPAVTILMTGYIEKNKLVSLKGTLVPATTINKIIASIPLLGKILVGKKAGEGVFGVSFRMKGPPKDIKTTVNPVKTLTPRFIVRAVEKMKKNKKAKQSD